MVEYRWSIAGGKVADCLSEGDCSGKGCFAQGTILDLTPEQFRRGGQVGLCTEVFSRSAEGTTTFVGELAVGTIELKPAHDPDRRPHVITSMENAVRNLRTGGCLVKLAQPQA